MRKIIYYTKYFQNGAKTFQTYFLKDIQSTNLGGGGGL